MFRTSICTLVNIGTIAQTVALREQESCLLSLLPLTESLPVLIVRPQIRALTSLRILQCDSQYSAVCITGDIVCKTKVLEVVTHLKWSLIVDDISLIAVLLVSRTQTAYLTTRKQELSGDVSSLCSINNIYLIYPSATVLIRNAINTNLEFIIVKRKYCTRLSYSCRVVNSTSSMFDEPLTALSFDKE